LKTWPFFAAPYGTKGVIAGVLTLHPSVSASEPSYLDGTLDWVKQETLKPVQYTAAFTGTVAVEGSQYLPRPEERALAVGSAVILTLSDGNLGTPLSEPVTFRLDNHFDIPPMGTLPSGNQLKLTLAVGAGTFSGSFLDRAAGKTRKFQGILLQHQRRADGLFTGDTETGSVRIRE